MTQSNALSRRILIFTLGLALFGILMLFSASAILAVQRHGSEFYFLIRQGGAVIVGMGLLYALSLTRYQIFAKFAVPILFLQIVLTAAIFIPSLSHSVLGATRWLRLGPVQFQPSELAKLSCAIYLSSILSRAMQGETSWPRTFLLLLPVGLLLALIFKQPDLGSTILLSCTVLGLFFIAGVRMIYVIGALCLGTPLFFFFTLQSEYRRRRILAFLNPWADPQGSGFQSIQSFLAFHSGHIAGVGIGNGNSKLFFLPEVHTDFIFALVGEELGFVGTVGLLIVFAYFIYLLFKVSRYAPDLFGRFLSFSIALSIALQVIVNVGGVTGLIPVKGLPLPFISWGRSALLVNLAMLGILLNVARQSVIIPKVKKSEGMNIA